MNSNKVQAYIDQQVTALADRRVKPIMDAINGELEGQRRNEAEKARLDGLTKESNDRVAALQKELVKANSEVNALSVKLAEAVAGAENTGEPVANP